MVPLHSRRAAAVVLQLLLRITPARSHVFVNSWPAEEGNGLETVRELQRRYSGRVVWVDAPSEDVLERAGIDTGTLVRARKNSLSGVRAFLTAEASFFTHGVYGCPRPSSRKPMINLWHGDGPKKHTGAKVPSTFMVSGSRVFGNYRAHEFGVAQKDLILSGLPRVAALLRTPSADTLVALGLDPDRPFVLWMPTYRQARGKGLNGSWNDLPDVSGDHELGSSIAPGLRALTELGIQVAVKPHPLDQASRQIEGVRLITDADLSRAGTTLYGLLAGSAGLLTDYSSVWTDYLVLDRPIGFYVPDLPAYVAGRGLFPPDAMEHLPGPQLISAADFTQWGQATLGRHGEAESLRRKEARRHFGLVLEHRPATVLLDELERRGALRLQR